MRRLTPTEKIRIEHVRKNREKSKKRRAARVRLRGRPGWLRTTSLMVPEYLDLSQNYEATVAFFDEIRYRTLIERQNIYLDFSECKSIDPGAGVLLTAEVQRGRFFGSPRTPRIHGNYPADKNIERFLADLGFFQQIGVATRDSGDEEGPRAQYIKVRTGIRDQGAAIEDLRQMVFSDVVTLDDRAARHVYRALSEAMSNVSRHAYDREMPRLFPVLFGRWWMAGRWDRESKKIMAIFFDQGVGIPATLPKTFPEIVQSILAALGLGPSDGPMIRAAMEIGRTRTQKTNRGKGLNDLKRIIDFVDAGRLTITSGRGRYEYQGAGREAAIDLPRSIGGTLIEWEISGTDLVIWKDEE